MCVGAHSNASVRSVPAALARLRPEAPLHTFASKPLEPKACLIGKAKVAVIHKVIQIICG